MGMDNITCPSKAPVAGCAVGVPASVRRRGFGPQLAAARLSCGLGLRSLGWLANAGGTAECGSSTARGNAVCGRTACTVWEGAGGNAPMMPSPMWIAGWHIGSAPLAYLITHGASRPFAVGVGCACEAGRPGQACGLRRSPLSSRGRHVDAVGARGRLLVLSVEASMGVPGCPSTRGVLVGWDGTAVSERAPFTVEESAEAILPAGSQVAGKGRTRSRAPRRSCSWSLR